MRRGGRIAGTKNKLTISVREKIQQVLNNCIDNLDLNELSNREKIELIGKLLPFVTPKYLSIVDQAKPEPNQIKPIEINL
jgi:hypothetical protein